MIDLEAEVIGVSVGEAQGGYPSASCQGPPESILQKKAPELGVQGDLPSGVGQPLFSYDWAIPVSP